MKRKYMMSWGLAFAEEKEMRKLERMAASGWHLETFAPFGFTLVEGEPMDVQYNLDYRKDADDDYFELFRASGWEHVTTAGDEIHIFKGAREARPIYSDAETTREKYATEATKMGRYAAWTLVAWLLIALLRLTSDGLVDTVGYIVQLVLTIGFVFTALPYVGYVFKRKRYEKNH